MASVTGFHAAYISQLTAKYQKGIFGDTMAEQMNILESEKSMLNGALMAERNRKEFSLKPETVLRFLDSFIGDINNPDTRRKLLDGLVENIYVYPDKLAVACFFSDDSRELPFEETIKLIEDSKSFRSPIFDPDFVPTEASRKMFESFLEDFEAEGGDESLDETEEPPGFFP